MPQATKNFRIYSSSAGSGKTYTLTREYLQLVIVRPDLFRNILAVTFTNKATEEMKGRIILALRELSLGKQSTLSDDLQQYAGISAAKLQEQAAFVLSKILHNYSQFAVSTIDSFFQRIIRSFAREADLSANFKLELDTNAALSEAIELLLQEVGKDAAITEWLTRFAEARVEDGKTWDMKNDIRRLANEIFNENFSRFEASLRPHLNDKEFLAQFQVSIKKLKTDFEAFMKKTGTAAEKAMQDYSLSVEDFSYGKSGVAQYFFKIQQAKGIAAYEYGARVAGALGDTEKWYPKKSTRKDEIANAVNYSLMALLEEAVSHYDKNKTKYATASEVLQYFYTLGLLANIAAKLQQYRDENDVFLMADAPRFLNGIIAGSDAPYLYEKVGNTYSHFLIDEFQDTSQMQWDNFKPLVANSLASGNLNLIVGDVKQSIYRWRGGDWKLLLEKIEIDMGAENTDRQYLNYNWRSKFNVIAFNNSIFAAAPILLIDKLLAEAEDPKNDIQAELKVKLEAEIFKIHTAYKDVYQFFPEAKKDKSNDDKGVVRFEFIDTAEDKDEIFDENKGFSDDAEEQEETEKISWKKIAQKRLISLAEELQETGYAASDIAFLVRNRADGVLVAQALVEHKNSEEASPRYIYDAISADSLLLKSATSVRLLTALLAYLHNTSDRIASAHILYEYCYYVLPKLNKEQKETHELPPLNELFGGVSYRSSAHSFDLLKRYLPSDFIDNRAYFNKLAIYELTEKLVSVFGLNRLDSERAYVQAFLDAILEYARNGNGDISSFQDWWDVQKEKLSVRVPESQNAMRIVTVHTSKGLEYPVVIIPFCDWELDHNTHHDNILWAKSDTTPFSQLPIIPVKYGSALAKTIYAEDYFVEKSQAHLDNLNLLYVAFTRAEQALICLSPKPKKIEAPTRISALLYQIVSGAASVPTHIDANKTDYLSLETFWDEETLTFEAGTWPTKVETHKKQKDETFVLSEFRSENWRNRLSIRPQSRGFFEADEEKKERYQKISFGLMLHNIMAGIRTDKDLKAALAEHYFGGQASKETIEELRNRVRAALAHPQVADWFSDKWQIYNESDIILKDGVTRRPDRIVISGTKAIVIDFKTGKASEKHTKQVNEYAKYMQQLGYETEGYLVYLPDSANAHDVRVEKC